MNWSFIPEDKIREKCVWFEIFFPQYLALKNILISSENLWVFLMESCEIDPQVAFAQWKLCIFVHFVGLLKFSIWKSGQIQTEEAMCCNGSIVLDEKGPQTGYGVSTGSMLISVLCRCVSSLCLQQTEDEQPNRSSQTWLKLNQNPRQCLNVLSFPFYYFF